MQNVSTQDAATGWRLIFKNDSDAQPCQYTHLLQTHGLLVGGGTTVGWRTADGGKWRRLEDVHTLVFLH